MQVTNNNEKNFKAHFSTEEGARFNVLLSTVHSPRITVAYRNRALVFGLNGNSTVSLNGSNVTAYDELSEEALFQAMTTDQYVQETLLVQQIYKAWITNGKTMTEELLNMIVSPEETETPKPKPNRRKK